MNLSLLRIVRTVVRADSDPARQVLFHNLMQAHWPVRLAYRLHERVAATSAAALLVAGYGAAVFLRISPPRHTGVRVLAVARHENARRQVARVASWVGISECGWIGTGLTARAGRAGLSAAAALLQARRLTRWIRVLRTIDGRYGFLVACRAAAAISWYTRTRGILDAYRPGAVLVSSDSNPEELGLVGAARALQIPQVFVSHAYPTPLSPPLDFSLSFLEGEAAVHARRRKGPIKGEVLLVGIEGDSAPLDPTRFTRPDPVIGVFTPKAVSWPALVAVIDDCRRHFGARRVVIRWHPSMLEHVNLADRLADLSNVVVSPRSASLQEVARQCDWVVADENSNVHLPVLKLGIPTVAVRNLGLYPESRSDLYGFVANGVVYPPVKSLRDVDPMAYVAFFSDAWRTRFGRYDVSYLRPLDAIGSEVRHAISGLLQRQAPAVATDA